MAFSVPRIPRILTHHRAFSACVILSLGVGISAGSAVIAVVDSMRHAPLPFANASRIEQVAYRRRSDPSRQWSDLPPEVARALKSGGSPVADVAVYKAEAMRLHDRDRVFDEIGLRVSPNFVSVLGAKMFLGRAFSAADASVPGIVLSFNFWTSKLGSDSSLVGRTIEVNGAPVVVTGISSRESEFPMTIVAWASDAAIANPGGTRRDVETLVLLDRPADPRMRATIVARATSAYYEAKAWRGAARPEITMESSPLRDFLLSSLRGVVLILTIIAVFVGLLSAVNFAALVLARGIRRRGELGVRAALGASVKMLAGEIVGECLVLCAMSGVLAALLAPMFVDIVRASFEQFLPAWFHIELSWRTIGWSVALAIGMGVIFGLGPAVDLSRPALATFLRAASGTTSDGGKLATARARLVAIQVALATAVLVSLGAVLGKTIFLARADTGFDHGSVAIGQAKDSSSAVSMRASNRLLDDVRAVPGVAGAGLIGYQTVSSLQIKPDGDAPGELPFQIASIDQISADFFAAMRPRLTAGRLTTRDEATSGAPVVVVTQDIAEHVFAGRSAVGRRLRLPTHPDQPLTIIGVIETFNLHPYLRGETPTIFISSAVRGGRASNTTDRTELWVRSSGNPDVTARAVQLLSAQHRFGRVQLIETRSVVASLARDYVTFRGLVRFVMGVFGVALGLAALGIYGLVAYTAEMRARELAIREAIGATRVHVSVLVLRGAIIQGVAGVAAGALLATLMIGYLNSYALQLHAIAGATTLSIVLVATTILLSSLGPLRSMWKRDLSAVLRV
jgi:putative ABC transport system permease protein